LQGGNVLSRYNLATMESETARDLLQMVVNAAQIAIRTEARTLAIEKALKVHNPTLYEAYEKDLQKQGAMASLNPAGVSDLLDRLIRH
jgi:hypothetical protein